MIGAKMTRKGKKGEVKTEMDSRKHQKKGKDSKEKYKNIHESTSKASLRQKLPENGIKRKERTKR